MIKKKEIDISRGIHTGSAVIRKGGGVCLTNTNTYLELYCIVDCRLQYDTRTVLLLFVVFMY